MLRHSDAVGALLPALVLAQGELTATTKDRNNPEYGSKYATLDAIMGQVRPVLARHGLVVAQGMARADEYVAITTRVMHTSGEFIENVTEVPNLGRRKSKGEGGGHYPPDAQSLGSAITYGRRYGISALLGLSSEDDDDGNKAVKGQRAAETADDVRAASASRAERPARQRASAPPAAPAAPEPAPYVYVPGTMPVGPKRGQPFADFTVKYLEQVRQWCASNGYAREQELIEGHLEERRLAAAAEEANAATGLDLAPAAVVDAAEATPAAPSGGADGSA